MIVFLVGIIISVALAFVAIAVDNRRDYDRCESKLRDETANSEEGS